jgi:hypothetical protein
MKFRPRFRAPHYPDRTCDSSDHLIDYQAAGEALFAGDRDIYATRPGSPFYQN